MYLDLPLHELGRRAFEVTERLHPEDYRTYVVDRNINYANWCTAKCIFCNFKADVPGTYTGRPELPDGYTLTLAQIGAKIEELLAIGGTQVLMQGGLVPADGPAGLPFERYLDLMRFIKREYPGIHVHAFSPPEIFAFHQVFGMSIRDVLARLREAGLDSVPGGGGEILSDRVRRKIGVGKTLTAEWLEVMRQCHALGMKTSCSMMFGHIETLDERIEHLRLLRALQDESLARGNGGGFTAFICWTFQPDNTPLGRMRQFPVDRRNAETPKRRNAETEEESGDRGIEGSRGTGTEARRHGGTKGPGHGGPSELKAQPSVPASDLRLPTSDHSAFRIPHSALAARPDDPSTRNSLLAPRHSAKPLNDGRHLLLADAHEYLTMLALSRVFLNNIPNLQSSWVTQGPKIGQLGLFFGANDMGSVMMEENVVSAAGTTYRLDEPTIRRLITDAGWRPQKRDFYYRLRP